MIVTIFLFFTALIIILAYLLIFITFFSKIRIFQNILFTLEKKSKDRLETIRALLGVLGLLLVFGFFSADGGGGGWRVYHLINNSLGITNFLGDFLGYYALMFLCLALFLIFLSLACMPFIDMHGGAIQGYRRELAVEKFIQSNKFLILENFFLVMRNDKVNLLELNNICIDKNIELNSSIYLSVINFENQNNLNKFMETNRELLNLYRDNSHFSGKVPTLGEYIDNNETLLGRPHWIQEVYKIIRNDNQPISPKCLEVKLYDIEYKRYSHDTRNGQFELDYSYPTSVLTPSFFENNEQTYLESIHLVDS